MGVALRATHGALGAYGGQGRVHTLHRPAPRGAIVSNALDPELMDPSQRLAEVAKLLATGFLRLRMRGADARQKPLDVLRRPSDECLEPKSGGET